MIKQATEQLNKNVRRARLRRKLNQAIIENIKNGMIYHASSGNYDILKGAYTREWQGAPGGLFVSPFKGIAANFIVNKQKILDNIESQLGGRVFGLNFGYGNWDESPDKLHKLPKDVTIYLNARGIKPIHGTSTGYLYTIDYTKNKNRAHMFDRNPNSDVEFLIDGDVPYKKREKVTVAWRAVPSEDSIKRHGEAKLIDSSVYEPPYNKKQLIENGYTAAVINRLLADPAHSWRMKSGIELIHREPTRTELERIWNNWQRMTDKQKALSDAKCMELFGVDNKTLYEYLMPQYKVESPDKGVVKYPRKSDGSSSEAISADTKTKIKEITFPSEEIDTLKKQNRIVTTRVSADYNKFFVDDLVRTPWGDIFKGTNREEISDVKDHPYFNELTEGQKKLLSKYAKIAVLTLMKTKVQDAIKLPTKQ